MKETITMKFQRHYKYLIKPTYEQKQILMRTFGAVRFVYNHYVDDLKAGKNMRGMAKNILSGYRAQFPFLNGIDGSALMHVIFQAQDKGNRLSRHKKRKDSRVSYTTANLKKSPIRIVDGRYIELPKLGNVELVYQRPIPEDAEIRNAALIREADGKYYVSIMVEYDRQIENRELDLSKSIGIDYSSTHLYVDDKGNKIDMPHFFKEDEKKIAESDLKLRRMEKGSKNYYKQKLKTAAYHQRVKNRRMDFMHKLTTELAEKYDVICIEDLDMQEISKNHHLGKRTYDNAYGLFDRYLRYKMKERGKLLLRADRYYPSSKTCHNCGHLNYKLKLSDRIWQCEQCGMILDRDVNAAINIKTKCLSDYNRRRVSGVSL